MATRLKPTRINVDNTPRVGDGASYQNDDNFRWSAGGGDMAYRDFEWVTLTGNSLVIENISNNITPSSDFTVSAGTVKPGIEYVLRVNTGNTPYTMTLGTGVTNPNSYKTELKPNTVNQFKFIATSTNQLELEGVDSAVVSEINWGEIGGTLADQTDLQTALNAKANDADVNTKTFWLASTSDTDNILAIGRYSYAGGNPIIIFGNQVYVKDSVSLDTITYRCSEVDMTPDNNTGLTVVSQKLLNVSYSKSTGPGGYEAEMYGCTTGTDTIGNVLQSGQNYTTSYTPEYNGSPATKKYVDDTAAGKISDTAYDATSWDGVTTIAPSKNAVRDKIVTMDSAISGNTSNISTINGKIPSEASTSNQLADKAFVGDSINSVTAYYITKNANGDQFATYAELAAATTFYSGGQVRVPTRNDYTIVLDDENHDHATTRYIYNSVWEYQYTVNETPLTQAQLNALNSGITAGKVSTYDGYATGKQDALVSGTNIKTINNTSILGGGNISVQPTLINQSNIKSVNGNSLLGSGNLVLYTSIQITLSSAGWTDSEQTVTAAGVTASNIVIVSPDPTSISDYAGSMVYCSAQGSNSLTFACSSDPENDITVNVLIMN